MPLLSISFLMAPNRVTFNANCSQFTADRSLFTVNSYLRTREAALPATFVEKVLARTSGHEHVVVGQIVDASPDVILSHDNTAAISKIFRALGQARVRYP